MLLRQYMLAFLFAFSFQALNGQDFIRAYGDMGANNIENALFSRSFNSHFLFGTTNENTPTLTRLDANGNILWTRSYSPGLYATDIVELIVPGQSAPDLAICMSRTGSYADVIVMRVRGSDGTVVWSYVYNPSSPVRFSHMVATADSNLVITATYGGNSGTYYAKLDANGNVLWSKRYVSSTGDQFAATGDIYPDKNGGVVGSCSGTSSNGLFRVDRNGNVVAYTRVNSRFIFRRIEKTDDGYVIAAMQDWSSRQNNQGVLRVDENLNLIWARRVNSAVPFTGSCSACATPSVAQTPAGDFIYVQETGLSGRIAYSVLKFSSNGQLLLSKTFDNADVAFNLLRTMSNGHILINGFTYRQDLCLPDNTMNGLFGVVTENINLCEMSNISPVSENWNINLVNTPLSNIVVTDESTNRANFSSQSLVITFNQSEFCETIQNKINLGNDTAICNGSLLLNAGTGYSSYLWSTGATTPTITVNSSGNYSVTVTTVCGTTLRDTIEVLRGIVASSSMDAVICQGDAYVLPDGSIVRAEGSYVVTLRASGGCDSLVTINLSVLPSPVVNIIADETIVSPGTTVTLTAQSPGNNQFLWESTNQLSGSTSETTTSVINTDTWFFVTVASANECKTRDSILIKVFRKDSIGEIFMPQAFSPNGDGVNDKAIVISTADGWVINAFRIYNRWGQLVFQANDFIPDGRINGWDGTNKGEPAPMDNYIYLIEATRPDGLKITSKGAILLLR